MTLLNQLYVDHMMGHQTPAQEALYPVENPGCCLCLFKRTPRTDTIMTEKKNNHLDVLKSCYLQIVTDAVKTGQAESIRLLVTQHLDAGMDNSLIKANRTKYEARRRKETRRETKVRSVLRSAQTVIRF